MHNGGQNHKWCWRGGRGVGRGGPQCFTAGRRIKSGPQVGSVATPTTSGSPPPWNSGYNQQWSRSRPGGYITPAALGVPTALERGKESKVARKWARWPRKPLPSWGSPTLQSGGKNQKWPTNGIGYVTLAPVGGSKRFRVSGRIKSGPQVDRWLHHPYLLGGPQSFKAGGKITSGPKVGRLTT